MDKNKNHWLTIIGIGEDGYDNLPQIQKDFIHKAAYIFGGSRHLSFLPETLKAQRIAWPYPFEKGIEYLCTFRGKNVVVLASGDPMHFGVGATLCRRVDISEILIFSHPSSFSLAAARIGWALQNTKTLSIHGRSLLGLVRYLQNGERLIILSENGNSPYAVARILSQHGYHNSRMTVLENLEGPEERITSYQASQLNDEEQFSNLNIIAIDCVAADDTSCFSLNSALPDVAFRNDGQLTKQDIRAITMAHLAPQNRQILWDIGAGCGSISIEWLRLAVNGKAYAIEKDPKRQAFIEHNAAALGVPELKLIKGGAPTSLIDLEAPDAIFIGGGFTHEQLFETCWQRLKPGGRMVVNAVTVETEALLHQYAGRVKARIMKVALSEMAPLGHFHVWRQSLPVTIMIAQK